MERVKFSKYAPKTDNLVSEGFRLALLNIIFLAIAGGLGYGALWLIDKVRELGIPLPLPVWLIMLCAGIPYFVMWFEYGRAFGVRSEKPSFLKGLGMGIIGQMPGFLLYYLISYLAGANVGGEPLKIAKIILRTLILVVPIMAALGSLDIKKGRFK